MRVRKYILKCHWFISFVNKLAVIGKKKERKKTKKNKKRERNSKWDCGHRHASATDFVVVDMNFFDVNGTNDYVYLCIFSYK